MIGKKNVVLGRDTNIGPALTKALEAHAFIEFLAEADPHIERLWIAFKAKQKILGEGQ